jgi:S-(hydroxymethyl)glutathione dehydrogenase/alcohol dehydrogenase
MRAAVLHEVGRPLEILDLDLAPLADHQVRVRVVASGVCHSDLSVMNGSMPQPTPCVPGHEGAGIVEAIGAAVTRVRPGDHVVLSWLPPCRKCFYCLGGQPYLCEEGIAAMYAGPYATVGNVGIWRGLGTATFAELAQVPERSVVRIDASIPLEIAALVGCAVTTGVGAVFHTARVEPGTTVAVVGCGGVGLSAIQGARLAGASRIIAADLRANRLALASQMGATDVVDASAGDPVAAVRGLTGGRGVDHAFEVVGRSDTIRLSFAMTRRGGTTTLVGAGRLDDEVRFNAMELFADAKRVLGCLYGSSDPDRDFPLLLEHHRAGRLELDRLVTRRISLDEVNDAFAAMEAGEGARTVIAFDR